MASYGRREPLADGLRRLPPLAWAAVFVAASPLFRVEWGGLTLYPVHWAATALVWWVVWRSWAGGTSAARTSGRRGRRFPAGRLLLAGVFVAALVGARQEWAALGVTLGALGLAYGWGWCAYRLGHGSGGAGSAADGLLLWLALTPVLGLLGWGASRFAAPLCRVVNCAARPEAVYLFRGGWSGPDQYLLHLILLLPLAGGLLLLLHRLRGADTRRTLLHVVLVACLLGLLAGAPRWGLLVAALGLAGAAWRLRPLALPRDRRLPRNVLLTVATCAVVVYGLFPGYLAPRGAGATGAGTVRIEPLEPLPTRLSSERAVVLPLRLTNEGLVPLFVPGHAARAGEKAGGGAPAARLRPRLLVTPPLGKTRAYLGAGTDLPGPLAPGRALEVRLHVRLPHWAREGFLAWVVEDADGTPALPAPDSHLGFRFVNEHYRELAQERENFLTPLARRARDYGRLTTPPPDAARDRDGPALQLGALLDTLIFSPLWGLPPAAPAPRGPFGAARPFWGQLFHHYGALGLLLVALALAAVARQASRLAAGAGSPEAPVVWRLVPLAVGLLALTGLFSPVLATYHALWGLFMVAGYAEGRHDQAFPLRAARAAPLQPPKPPRVPLWRRWPRRPAHARRPPRSRAASRMRWLPWPFTRRPRGVAPSVYRPPRPPRGWRLWPFGRRTGSRTYRPLPYRPHRRPPTYRR